MVKGPAVTIVEKGGIPVRAVERNAPLLTVAQGGFPITLSDRGAPFIVDGVIPPIPANGISLDGTDGMLLSLDGSDGLIILLEAA